MGWREGSGTSAELDKATDLKDTGNSVGVGLTGKLNPKVKLGADLQWSRTKSEINQALTALTISPTTGAAVATSGTNLYATGTAAAQLPDITSTSTRIKLFVEYALKKNADLRFDLIHERWKTDDWTWQFSDGTAYIYGGTTTDGTMVITDPKQNATFAGVSYRFKF
jgi:predicted porin